jgi:glutamate synthase (ferredoxin)
MSLKIRLGARGNFLTETAEQARLLELDRPFLTNGELIALKADPELNTVTLSTLFTVSNGPIGMERAIECLCDRAEREVREGAQVLH